MHIWKAVLALACCWGLAVGNVEAQGVTLRVSSETVLPGQPFAVSLTAEGFTSVTTVQFTLRWDPAVIAYAGFGDANLPALAESHFGAGHAEAGTLTFSWDDPAATGVSVADGTTLFRLFFAAAGEAGTRTSVAFADSPTVREVTVNFEPVAFDGVDGSVDVTGTPAFRISLPELAVEEGTGQLVPVQVDFLRGAVLRSYAFTLAYDAGVLGVAGVRVGGTLSEGGTVAVEAGPSGHLVVAHTRDEPIARGGTLLLLDASFFRQGTSTLTLSDVRVNDGHEAASLIPGVVTVTAANAPPVARPDTAVTDEDAAVTVDVLANDDDPDGGLDPASVRLVRQPAHGTARVDTATGAVDYAPEAGYSGTDSLSYTVADHAGAVSGPAGVTIVVRDVNWPPAFDTVPVLVSPADGAVLLVGGAPGETPADPDTPFVVAWQPATDRDGDPVSYRWHLAREDDFASLVADLDAGTDARLTLSLGGLAAYLDGLDVRLDDSIELYHRVVATDGEHHTFAPAASLTLTRGTLTSAEQGPHPAAYALGAAYPNPTGGRVTIPYGIPAPSFVVLKLYDVLGEEVATMASQPQPAGRYTVTFDGSHLAAGVYLYRLSAGGFSATGYLTILH